MPFTILVHFQLSLGYSLSNSLGHHCAHHRPLSLYLSWWTLNQVSAIAFLFQGSWLCPSQALLVDSLSLRLFAFFELYQLLILSYKIHLLPFIHTIAFPKVLNLSLSLFHLANYLYSYVGITCFLTSYWSCPHSSFIRLLPLFRQLVITSSHVG